MGKARKRRPSWKGRRWRKATRRPSTALTASSVKEVKSHFSPLSVEPWDQPVPARGAGGYRSPPPGGRPGTGAAGGVRRGASPNGEAAASHPVPFLHPQYVGMARRWGQRWGSPLVWLSIAGTGAREQGGLELATELPAGPRRGCFASPSRAKGRSCTEGAVVAKDCGASSLGSREQGREPRVSSLLLLKLLGKARVGGWSGPAKRLQPEQGGGEGLLPRGQPLPPLRLCPAPRLGRSGGAGEGPVGRPVRGSGCPAHAQALVKARQKYQMSWSNICTTFPAFTKKAFYTQSTLGDELGKQRGGSPLKLTLWLCTDKASASSSLM